MLKGYVETNPNAGKISPRVLEHMARCEREIKRQERRKQAAQERIERVERRIEEGMKG